MKAIQNRIRHSLRNAARRAVQAALTIGALLGWTASAGTLYVWHDSPDPAPPFDTWAKAATNIQDAVDAAVDGDTVLVMAGVYATGGRAVFGTLINRVAIDKAIDVQSVNGPEVTVIEGASAPGGGNGNGAIRCVYLGVNAVLSGFTLFNGNTRKSGDPDNEQSGGGAWCETTATLTNCIIASNLAYHGGGSYGGTLYNCTLTGNRATDRGGGSCNGTLHNCTLFGNSAGGGGGAYYGTFYNCTLTGNAATDGGGALHGTFYNCSFTVNSAANGGGGVSGGTLYNCSLTVNSAASGGGVSGGTLYNCTLRGNSGSENSGGCLDGTLYNCIVYFNTAPIWPNYFASTFNYSCTTPQPSSGTGNITNTPAFADQLAGNLRLQTNSPCINVGNNTYVQGSADLDGRARIAGGTVDMGAYESETSVSGVFLGWLQFHGMATDGSVDFIDTDGDLMNAWEEWLADTDPTNALSSFQIEEISKSFPAMVSFQSSSNRTYTLWSTPQLAPLDWTPVPAAQAVPGNGGTLTLIDPTNAPQKFYRVQVNLP
jgi:hypothetical protein